MSIPLTRIFSTQYTADPVSQTARPSFPTPYYDNYQQWTSTPYSYNHAGPPPPFNPEAVSTTTVSFPALPKHWSTEFPSVTPHFVRHLLELTFTILCMVAFGHTTLEHKWRVTCSSEEVFAKDKELVTNRLVTISVVASLLLASTAALVTTEPPETAILNYTIRGPYLCLWFSFGILLGGVIVASADVYVLATCSPAWARKVLMATRMRIWCVLILLAYPFFAVGMGVIVCVMGLLAAAWMSEDRIVQIGCGFLLLVPASLILAFLFTVRGALPEDVPVSP